MVILKNWKKNWKKKRKLVNNSGDENEEKERIKDLEAEIKYLKAEWEKTWPGKGSLKKRQKKLTTKYWQDDIKKWTDLNSHKSGVLWALKRNSLRGEICTKKEWTDICAVIDSNAKETIEQWANNKKKKINTIKIKLNELNESYKLKRSTKLETKIKKLNKELKMHEKNLNEKSYHLKKRISKKKCELWDSILSRQIQKEINANEKTFTEIGYGVKKHAKDIAMHKKNQGNVCYHKTVGDYIRGAMLFEQQLKSAPFNARNLREKKIKQINQTLKRKTDHKKQSSPKRAKKSKRKATRKRKTDHKKKSSPKRAKKNNEKDNAGEARIIRMTPWQRREKEALERAIAESLESLARQNQLAKTNKASLREQENTNNPKGKGKQKENFVPPPAKKVKTDVDSHLLANERFERARKQSKLTAGQEEFKRNRAKGEGSSTDSGPQPFENESYSDWKQRTKDKKRKRSGRKRYKRRKKHTKRKRYKRHKKHTKRKRYKRRKKHTKRKIYKRRKRYTKKR